MPSTKVLVLLSSAASAAAQTWSMKFYSTADCTGISSSLDAPAGKCLNTDAFSPGTFINLRVDFTTCEAAAVKATVFDEAGCTGTGVPATISDFSAFDGKCGEVIRDITYMKATCSSVPCFARDTTDAVLSSGETVLMSSLRAGDMVRDGPDSLTRVIVNQHAAVDKSSPLLNIEHADGTISLTADHVLSVDGKFVAAREAVTGTKLGESVVSHVSKSNGGIINPLTTSGKISADGVLASTYPEWIAGFAMSYPIYLTAANMLSFLFPASTQAYYDAHLEQFFTSTVSSLQAVPAPLVAVVFHIADLVLSAGLVAYTLASLKAVLAIAAVIAMTQTSK